MQTDNIPNIEKKLKDCQAILSYLSTYPEVLKEMGINELLNPEKLHQQYLDWKKLVPKFEGLEKDLYKDYWLPIESDNFQFFIDLSSPDYPIVETIYLNGGDENPEEYISSNLFLSASEFFLLIEDPAELSNYYERHLMRVYFRYSHEVDRDFNPFK